MKQSENNQKNKSSWYRRMLKPMVKILFVLNFTLLSVIGCLDADFEKTLLKAAIGIIIDKGFNQEFDSTKIKYFVASALPVRHDYKGGKFLLV